MSGHQFGQRLAHQPAGLRSSTLANQTGRVKDPCVRLAWCIGEHVLGGVPDRWRRYRAVSR